MTSLIRDDALNLTTSGFAGDMLGLSLYDGQGRSCMPIEKSPTIVGAPSNAVRQNVAICTPNGSGKDDRIIPTMAYWWLFYNPRGRVIITSKSALQLETQTIPSLDKHYQKFGWAEPVRSPRYHLITPTGGDLIAYVTNEGVRVEGAHSRPGEPLLMIVNEAKSVDDQIFEGIDRCTPDCLVLISSPGLRFGRFYQAFTKLRAFYTCIQVGLKDCPHIPKERIDHTIATYGLHHPITRSTLFGEFMSQTEGEQFCITIEEVEAALFYPPKWKPGFKCFFFDFADGRAENVFFVRNGNKYEMLDAWREQNEDAVVGRAIALIKENGFKPGQGGADAAAKQILDKMARAGYA